MIKKRFDKLNNKAFTLVEIVVAIAVFAMAAVAIGAMIISSKNNTANMFNEAELQQQSVEVKEAISNEILSTTTGIQRWVKASSSNFELTLEKNNNQSETIIAFYNFDAQKYVLTKTYYLYNPQAKTLKKTESIQPINKSKDYGSTIRETIVSNRGEQIEIQTDITINGAVTTKQETISNWKLVSIDMSIFEIDLSGYNDARLVSYEIEIQQDGVDYKTKDTINLKNSIAVNSDMYVENYHNIIIEKPVLTNTSFEYDRKTHGPTEENYQEYIRFVERDASSTLSATEADVYEVIYKLRDPSSTTWSDGTTDPIIYTWEIKKMAGLITDSGMKHWVTLLDEEIISVDNGIVSCNKPNELNGELILPDDGSIIGVGNNAFKDCVGLVAITVPNSVTSVGVFAFDNCHSLTYGTYKNAKYLGNEYNPYLVLVESTSDDIIDCEIDYRTKIICSYAFSNCDSLTEIVIPDSITSLSDSAFVSCDSLRSVTIGDSVTSVDDDAFRNCNIKELIVAPGSKTITSTMVVSNAIEKVVIPNSVISIDESAFFACNNLQSINMPNSITNIGNQAFLGCDSLESVAIPSGVTSIGERAFYECRGLRSITIGDNVTSIGTDAFYNCNIKELIVAPGSKTITSTMVVSNAIEKVIIPDSVTSIDYSAFEGCTSITSITIPNSVTSIGINAFFECKSLTSVTIPNSVTSIGHSAFTYCTSLTHITIPDSVTSIGDRVFYGCGSLESAVIPSGVTSIGERAFYGCRGLRSITIGDNVTNIGTDAFRNCNIKELIVAPGSQTITSTMVVSNAIEKVIIPDSVTSIGSDAFSNCSSLTSIAIPDSVTSIGSLAFSNCSSLTNIIIPNKVDGIHIGTFVGCTSLISITIPNSVKVVSAYAFQDCTSLSSITFEGTMGQWNNIIEDDWNYNSSVEKVVCSNGTIAIY